MICGFSKYRFYISTDDATFTRLYLSKEITFSKKKEKDQVFYRQTSTEWRFTRALNPMVYDTILALIKDPTSSTHSITVRCMILDTSEAEIATQFEGTANLFKIKVDEDQQTLELVPEVSDEYSWWDEWKEKKFDAYQQGGGTSYSWRTITYSPVATKYRIFQKTHLGASGYVGAGEDPDAWALSQQYTVTNGDTGFNRKGWVMDGGLSYRCIRSHYSTAANAPGNVTYWEQVDAYCYIQHQIDLPASGWYQGNNMYDSGFPNHTALEPGATNCPTTMYYKATSSSTVADQTLTDAAKTLIDFSGTDGMLNKLIEWSGVGIGITSQFFSSATNPVTGLTNRLTNLCISVKSSIIDYAAGLSKTNAKYEITMKDLFDMMRDVFNVYWYMDGSNIVIEHDSFFRNGYAYGGTPVVGVDLTDETTYPLKYQVLKDITGAYRKTKYEINGDELVEKEFFRFTEQWGYDGCIEYSCEFLKKGSEARREPKVMTDVYLIKLYPAKVTGDGAMLLCCDANYKLRTRDAMKIGYIPGQYGAGTIFTNIVNGDLYWDNLLCDFHLSGRCFDNGRINYNLKTFAAKRIVKQDPIIFPRASVIDVTQLVKTNMGDGEILQLDVSTENDFCKVILLYEI